MLARNGESSSNDKDFYSQHSRDNKKEGFERKSVKQIKSAPNYIVKAGEKSLVKKNDYENLYRVFRLKDLNIKFRSILGASSAKTIPKIAKVKNTILKDKINPNHLKLVVISALVLFNLFLLLSNFTVKYKVFIGNQYLGTVNDKNEINRIIDKASKQISEQEKEEVCFEDKPTLKPAVYWKSQTVNTDEVIKNLKDRGLYKKKGYAICVNGKEMLVVSSKSMAENLLEKLKEPFKKTPDTKVEFVDNIVIKEKAMEKLNKVSFDQALALLSKTKEETKIYKVQKGDTLWLIARKNDMTVDQILELNPELSEVIKEGQEIKLNKPVPLINVRTKNIETITEKIQKEPVTQNEKVGTKVPPPRWATGSFNKPVFGVITSRFGNRWGTIHEGIDIEGNMGEPIYAADAGRVIFAGTESGYGKVVKINHDNEYTTYYGHCSEILVKRGSRVAKGEKIALIGRTGRTTGSHLHFEIRKNGVPQNPTKYF